MTRPAAGRAPAGLMSGGTVRTPSPLKPGDTVRIIAPASPFRRDRVDAGVEILQTFGLKVAWRDDVYAQCDYLAGDDARRAAELAGAFTAPGVAAVLPARGGYGSVRTCRELGSPDCFLPRMLIGFSDITALHVWLGRDAGIVTFHGPNVSTLSSLEPSTLEQYRRTLFGIDPDRNFAWGGLSTVRGGRATGRTLVGNLTVLASLAGTPFEPDLAGRILVVEDLNEAPYRIDRLLFQLSNTRGFAAVSGIVFGDFMLAGDDLAGFERLIAGYADRWAVPVATGFPSGHGERNDCVPQGIDAELDASAGRLAVRNPWS